MNEQQNTQSALVFVEQQMAEFADHDAKIHELNAQMDKEIFEIRKKYADPITELQQKKDQVFNNLEGFAVENQDLIFSAKRSFKTKFGSFGFRVGKPKLILLGDTSWAKITDLLKTSLPSYVRQIYEPAKDKLLADFNTPTVQMFVPAMGLKVTQDEVFFIDLKK